MTVWARTQGRRVNSFAFTWPAFHSCLSRGAGGQRRPGAPGDPNTCSPRRPNPLALWLLSH